MKFYYSLDFSKKEQKYVFVDMKILLEDFKRDNLELILPVWSPGSYLVREYARHLDCFSSDCKVEKITKNKWVFDINNKKEINLSYRLYCNELTVRTNYIDDIHVILCGPATFLVPENKKDSNYFEVKINLPSDWSKISTGLKKLDNNIFYHEDLDDFLDCPIEAGEYPVFEFESFGKKHEIAMIGPKVYNEEKLVSDIKRAVEATATIFKDIPYDDYTFITHLTNDVQGGLEHKNSTVLHFKKWDFQDPEKYKKDWLSLVSHEYFHLWNIKRLKPIELVDFDYNNENYTSLLWFAEGFTSYYDDLVLRRANIYNDNEYLDVLASVVEKLVKVPGRFYQSLEDSSFDAWTKFYRKHENSSNQQISYYVKGAQFALCLDFEIRKRTNNKNNLDDLMRKLWSEHIKDPNFGYTKEIILDLLNEIAGDFSEMFNEFLLKPEEIDYNKYLNYVGLKLKIVDLGRPTLDMDLKEDKGVLLCLGLKDKGAAYEAGIMVGDEILALNGYRVNHLNLVKRLKYMKSGEKVKLLISRDERILEKELTISTSKYDQIKIEKIENPSNEQKENYNNWLNTF
ncbi:MAG: PDZ domain-containing protein [Candidatus Sericytochromatia bacterium]